ncbi:MAG: hypothetical protein P8Y95_05885, partial [Gammaproteobacteria bacterium]
MAYRLAVASGGRGPEMRVMDTNVPSIRGAARWLIIGLCLAVTGANAAVESDPVDATLRDAFIASQSGEYGRALGLYMQALTQVSADESSLYRIPT